MNRPWTFPDVRAVLMALALWHAFFAALIWVAAERTTTNRIAAEAACPGPEPAFRRVIDLSNLTVTCHYHRRKS